MARRPGPQRKRLTKLTTTPRKKGQQWDKSLQDKAGNAWAKASEAKKAAALREAEDFVSTHFAFRGEPKTVPQAGPWPRVRAKYDNGKAITGVPDEYTSAVAIAATYVAAKVSLQKVQAIAHIISALGPVIEAPKEIEGL